MDSTELVRRYYDALDQGTYGTLESILTADFVHERPDRTLDGRERFVTFMRSERPQTGTTHIIDSLISEEERVVAEGQVLRQDGTRMFRFADVHEIADGQISSLRTYTD